MAIMEHPTHLDLPHHQRWVKSAHWMITLSFIALTITGYEMIMVHPRFYWGEVGNELTPVLFELPVSRNYRHGGWEKSISFFERSGSPVSAGRTYDIFNQNGWGRSLHFLGGWFLVITGFIYLLGGIFTGHLRKNLWPSVQQHSMQLFWQEIVSHWRMQIPPATMGPHYGLLQKITYLLVIFILMPLIILTGMTMSPAITAAYPFLLKLFLGAQSARTLHLLFSASLVFFVIIHLIMIVKSGFKQHLRAMTIGK